MTIENPEDVCLDLPVQEIWNQALEILSKRLSQPSFESWIRPAQLVELSANEAVLAVANDFTKSWIASKNTNDIEAALNQVLGRKIVVRIIVDGDVKQNEYTPSIGSISVMPARSQSREQEKPNIGFEQTHRMGQTNINPKYGFDSYVVGSSNRFTHSAALAVAEKPGQSYNPLFLYGGVGLGKTHLLHAIGNQILKNAPNTVVRYMSCEKFTNDLINSIQHGNMSEFRKRYRQIDLLLMDDIQFIEKKESTQEEFFHTFNTLRESGKQIVLTSDRPPKALAHLEERLRSRFEWGLIADVQAPDYEMRLAILRKKAFEEKMIAPDSVLDYIANTFTNNIRELEGALLRAHAFASLTGESLTPATVQQVLQPGAVRKEKAPITIERLIDAVCAYYKVEPSDLKSARRSADLTAPRHIAMYLAHEIMSLSFPRVGQNFGNRKHTSALYAYDKVKTAIVEDPEIARVVNELTRQLDR